MPCSLIIPSFTLLIICKSPTFLYIYIFFFYRCSCFCSINKKVKFRLLKVEVTHQSVGFRICHAIKTIIKALEHKPSGGGGRKQIWQQLNKKLRLYSGRSSCRNPDADRLREDMEVPLRREGKHKQLLPELVYTECHVSHSPGLFVVLCGNTAAWRGSQTHLTWRAREGASWGGSFLHIRRVSLLYATYRTRRFSPWGQRFLACILRFNWTHFLHVLWAYCPWVKNLSHKSCCYKAPKRKFAFNIFCKSNRPTHCTWLLRSSLWCFCADPFISSWLPAIWKWLHWGGGGHWIPHM